MDFFKNKTSRNTHPSDTFCCPPRARKKAASLVHTDQHWLGNSDLKTSSPLEQSQMVWKTVPPTPPPTALVLNICCGESEVFSQGGFSCSSGEGTWPELFPFSRKRFEASGWEPPCRKSAFHLVHLWPPRPCIATHLTLKLLKGLRLWCSQLLPGSCGSLWVSASFIMDSCFPLSLPSL